jgi:hypothetical protein
MASTNTHHHIVISEMLYQVHNTFRLSLHIACVLNIFVLRGVTVDEFGLVNWIY